jgi:large subunit ribosomal protein L7/L12
MPAKKDDEKKKAEAVEEKAEDKKAEEAAGKAEKPKAEKPKTEKKKTEKKAEEKAAPEPEAAKEKEEKKVEVSSKNVAKIVEAVEKMTVLELSELVKVLEDKFGVTAAAPMAMMPGMMAGAAGAAEEAEEKTEFDVILKDFGSQKIQVIKVVRAITGAGLIDAKKMVEELPSNIKEGIGKEEAEEVKKQLEEAGATIEIK